MPIIVHTHFTNKIVHLGNKWANGVTPPPPPQNYYTLQHLCKGGNYRGETAHGTVFNQ